MALLAVGRLPGLARRCSSNFYFGRRTVPGAPIVLALSRQGKNFPAWDRRTAPGRTGSTSPLSREISGDRKNAHAAVSRANSPEKGMRPGDRCAAASRFRRTGLARDCWSRSNWLDAAVTRACRADGRFAARYFRRYARRAAKTRSIRKCRGVDSSFASGEFRNVGDRGPFLWGASFDFGSREYLARD